MAARARNSVTASVATGGPASPGNSHRLHPPYAFGLDIERDTARRQNPQIRGPPGQLPAGTPGRFQHMLAVVDNQQRPAARHRFGHRVKPCRRLGPPDPHRLNQGGHHLLLGAAWHQVDIARQLRPRGRYFGPCRLNRQRGLPDSPDAGQRHHPVSAKPGGNLREVCGSPDKGEPSRWQPHRTVPAGITVTTGELAGDLRHQPTLTPWPEASQARRTPPAAGSAQVAPPPHHCAAKHSNQVPPHSSKRQQPPAHPQAPRAAAQANQKTRCPR